MARRVGKLAADTTVFFLCDIQEKFAPMIKYFPEICQVAQRLTVASKKLEIPLVATEHYPRGLGPIVSEIDIAHAKVFHKTQFSMLVPKVDEYIKSFQPGLKSVVLFGIEVGHYYFDRSIHNSFSYKLRKQYLAKQRCRYS